MNKPKWYEERRREMDPDKCLEELRDLLCEINDTWRFHENSPMVEDVLDRFTALDGWLSEGGYLPKGWRQK